MRVDGMVRSVREAELTQGPQRILKAADASGWYTVATVGSGKFKLSISTSLVIRGWRALAGQPETGHFVSVYLADDEGGWKHDVSYLWRRQHEVVAELPRQVVRFESPVPTPDRVGVTELVKALKAEVQFRDDHDAGSTPDDSAGR